MNINYYIIATFFILTFQLSTAQKAKPQLLFICMNGYDKYHVDTFFTLCKHVDFEPTFAQFYDLNLETVNNYSAIVISFDAPFLSSLAQKNINNTPIHGGSLLTKGTLLLNTLANLKEKVFVLLFPSHNNPAVHLAYWDICMQYKLLPLLDTELKQHCNQFFFQWLMKPDVEKSAHYDTALLAQKPAGAPKTCPILPPLIKEKEVIATLMPQQTIDPIALYLKHGSNHCVISKSSLMLCTEINENFIYTPLDFQERQRTLLTIATVLEHIKQIALNKTMDPHAIMHVPPLPSILGEKNIKSLQQKNTDAQAFIKKNFASNKIWLGWTELRTYKEDPALAARNILQAGLNSIWIELVPERYFGKNGVKKDQKDSFMQDLTLFIKALEQESKSLALSLPHIFAGTNITANFYKNFTQNILPKNIQTVDAYGTLYSRIPAPLDRQFWYEEVIDPLQKFIKAWQKELPSITLSGIFFDFEMYLNDQAGEYENLMDYSESTWNIYAEKAAQPELKQLKTVQKRISYLLQNNKMNHYMQLLMQDAYTLGNWVRQSIKQLLPTAFIGAYSINLPYKWFYLGMFAGLSDKINPLILATFNNEFYPHLPWLLQHNIHAVHLPVIMLSKLRSTADAALIKQLADHNDGVWFNRISHWEEPKNPRLWPWDFGAEVSPLETTECINLIAKTIKEVD